MGNRRSSRWRGHRRKRTVEECDVIDISSWTGQHHAWRMEIRSEMWDWLDEKGHAIIPDVVLGLGMEEKIEVDVAITAGNWLCDYRYWFVCPLCSTRCKKMYRPPETEKYYCRKCQNLTYASTQGTKPTMFDERLLKCLGL
jgi:hypothetical protein